jgi:hypothetical protein
MDLMPSSPPWAPTHMIAAPWPLSLAPWPGPHLTLPPPSQLLSLAPARYLQSYESHASVSDLRGRGFSIEHVVESQIPCISSEEMRAWALEVGYFMGLAGSSIRMDSTIQLRLVSFLPRPPKALLYRASKDGWSSGDFHRLCDNKGPTLVLLQDTGGFIFGGYAGQAWHSSGGWITCGESFLFSLTNPRGTAPEKLPLTGRNNGHAMCSHSSYGPLFGYNGADITVRNNPNTSGSGSYTKLGDTYTLPPGCDATTFFTGSRDFTLREMEVYSV